MYNFLCLIFFRIHDISVCDLGRKIRFYFSSLFLSRIRDLGWKNCLIRIREH
jgi:hypothetical protein